MNVTYFTGAGASALALPTVGDKFNKRFGYFCEALIFHTRSQQTWNTERLFINKVKNELPYHYSIDTYARKLCFQNQNEYCALKILMSYYFLFEQLGNRIQEYRLATSMQENLEREFKNDRKKLDPRYDVIYAALLKEDTRKLPGNLHFITWNYDIQLELSLSGFLNIPLNDSFNSLEVFPAPNCATDTKHAKVIKLNGTAGLTYKSDGNGKSYKFLNIEYGHGFQPNHFSTCLKEIKENLNAGELKSYDSMLHFAWEQVVEVAQARKKAKEIIDKTEVLVIIGYSFPLYNRKIDAEILSGLIADSIIIQIPEGQISAVKERLLSLIGVEHEYKIIENRDENQFYMPNEILIY
jgi:hypothetical protein